MTARLAKLLGVALAVTAFDQLLKALAVALLPPQGIVLIPGFFDLVLVYNRGAAFGFLAALDHGPWLLMGVTVLALGLAVWMSRTSLGQSSWVLLCLGLISGGALGNLVDRLRIGLVVDFLLVHWHNLYWPAFNLADSAITVGGLALAGILAFQKEKEEEQG